MIIPTFKTVKPYFYDFDDKGLAHSYQDEPPGYSNPKILYTFKYEGLVDRINKPKDYIWTVNPPFFIVNGQGTKNITLQMIPELTKERESILNVIRNLTFRDLKYSELNIKVLKWDETLNLYYRQGPLWKIEGNRNPKKSKIETYKIIPQYDQSGFPPKNKTNINSYSFMVKNGKVINFYGGTPPNNYPIVDILWYEKGPSYLSFYSAWENETLKFPNTLDIYVSD